MRSIVISTLILAGGLAGGPALAGSITPIGGHHVVNTSTVTLHCETCPPAQPRQKSSSGSYHVPELPPGSTQSSRVVDINGERKLERIEAWFGGSPVVHINKLPEWMTDAAVQGSHAAAAGVEPDSWVDTEATTSAVEADKPALRLDGFELRGNRSAPAD